MSENAELPSLPIPGQPESVAAPETKTEKREKSALAEQKAAFSNLLKEQKERTAVRKDEPRRKIEKDAPVEAKASEAPEPVKPEAQPAPVSALAPSPEVERLRAKLLLAGAPKKAIETLSDGDVREWWKSQEKRESDAALALQRAAEAENKLASLKGTTGNAEQVPTAAPDLDDIAATLAAQFGQDEAGTLLTALQGLMAPLQRELGETKAILANARERGLQDISTQNRNRLAAKLPMLKENDSAWKVIHAQALERSKSDPSRYSSADAVYDDVYNDLYGGLQTAAPAPVPDKSAEEKARVAASALTPPGHTKREKRITPMDAAFSAFKVLRKDPDNLEGAKRAYAEARIPQ